MTDFDWKQYQKGYKGKIASKKTKKERRQKEWYWKRVEKLFQRKSVFNQNNQWCNRWIENPTDYCDLWTFAFLSFICHLAHLMLITYLDILSISSGFCQYWSSNDALDVNFSL